MTIHCFENQLRYTVGYTLNEYYIIIKYTHLPIRYRVTISKIPALTKVFHSSNISNTYRLIWCPIYLFSLSLSLSLCLLVPSSSFSAAYILRLSLLRLTLPVFFRLSLLCLSSSTSPSIDHSPSTDFFPCSKSLSIPSRGNTLRWTSFHFTLCP